MSDRIDVRTYLAGPEDLRRQELVWGMVHEPPAPRYGHQSVVTRTLVILDQHVRAHRLGIVCVAPLDVVLDRRGLVVQPDVVFVSNERADIVRHYVCGAPDLVVEVESRGTRVRDRTTKMRWYRKYGVGEYWLVDPVAHRVVVVAFREGGRPVRRRFEGERPVTSSVLPAFAVPAREFFS